MSDETDTPYARLVARIAEVAAAVRWQAGVDATNTAGLIVSVLHANPHEIDRFMSEGSELFIDGTICAENGTLSYRAINGKILTPSDLRRSKGKQQ